MGSVEQVELPAATPEVLEAEYSDSTREAYIKRLDFRVRSLELQLIGAVEQQNKNSTTIKLALETLAKEVYKPSVFARIKQWFVQA